MFVWMAATLSHKIPKVQEPGQTLSLPMEKNSFAVST